MTIFKNIFSSNLYRFLNIIIKDNFLFYYSLSLYIYIYMCVCVCREYIGSMVHEKINVSYSVVKSDMIVDFFIQNLCCERSLVTESKLLFCDPDIYKQIDCWFTTDITKRCEIYTWQYKFLNFFKLFFFKYLHFVLRWFIGQACIFIDCRQEKVNSSRGKTIELVSS